MLSSRTKGRYRGASGFTLLEVLITMIILAFGLLGLAGMQSAMHLAEVESFQRAQAVLLLQDFGSRIRAAGVNGAAAYVTGTGTDEPLGTDTEFDCSSPTTRADIDKCEWSNLLLGASETKGGANVGGMIGARGCVEELQASDASAGVCTAGVYRVTVAWQGLKGTVAPSLACGQDEYGSETQRRAISVLVTLGLPRCT